MTKLLDHAVELGHAFQQHETALHVAVRLQHPAIPVGHLAKGQAGVMIAALAHQQMKVPAHEIEAVIVRRQDSRIPLRRWRRSVGFRQTASRVPLAELSENPRIEQRPTADGNARTARDLEHANRVVDAAECRRCR